MIWLNEERLVKKIYTALLGTLGVITEVSLKIRPLPPVRKYASFVFPDFETGIAFMREVAREVNPLEFYNSTNLFSNFHVNHWIILFYLFYLIYSFILVNSITIM